MADQNLTQKTATTTLAGVDLLYALRDPAGTPVDRKIAFSDLVTNIVGSSSLTGINATKIADGSVSNTEFQFLDGVSSNIQTQLNAKGSGTVTSVGLTVGTSGTNIAVSGSPITTSGSITLNIPTASASNRGALSAADWITFNNKLGSVPTLNQVLSTGNTNGGLNIQGSNFLTATSTDISILNNQATQRVIGLDADNNVYLKGFDGAGGAFGYGFDDNGNPEMGDFMELGNKAKFKVTDGLYGTFEGRYNSIDQSKLFLADFSNGIAAIGDLDSRQFDNRIVVTDANRTIEAYGVTELLDNGTINYSGSGPDDMSYDGVYVGATLPADYEIHINTEGTPDSFDWTDGTATGLNIPIVANQPYPLGANGIYITFATDTGHTTGDTWTFEISSAGNTSNKSIDIDTAARTYQFGNTQNVGSEAMKLYINDKDKAAILGYGTLNGTNAFVSDDYSQLSAINAASGRGQKLVFSNISQQAGIAINGETNLLLDANLKTYGIGDLDAANNGTKLEVNDDSSLIYARGDGFEFRGLSASIGDTDTLGNSTYISLDDATKNISLKTDLIDKLTINGAAAQYTFGDGTTPQHDYLQISDANDTQTSSIYGSFVRVYELVFAGSGSNDLTKTGTFTGREGLNYVVTINNDGSSPQTFDWTDGVDGANDVEITAAAPQLLSNGISITFASDVGHTTGDTWTFGYVVNPGKWLNVDSLNGKAVLGDGSLAGNNTGVTVNNATNDVSVNGSFFQNTVIVQTGSGLNDLTKFADNFSGPLDTTYDYVIQIDSEATPDLFSWIDGQGGSGTNVPIVAGPMALSAGVTITWGADTGHTAGDTFRFSVGRLSQQFADFDFKNQVLTIGDVLATNFGHTLQMNAGSGIYLGNYTQGTNLQIQPAGGGIAVLTANDTDSGEKYQLNMNAAGGSIQLGDANTSSNRDYIEILPTGNIISAWFNDTFRALKLDYSNSIFSIGDTDAVTAAGTKLDIDLGNRRLLTVGGKVDTSMTTIAHGANLSPTPANYVINVSGGSGPSTITLSNSDFLVGTVLVINDADATALVNNIVIDATSGKTMNATTLVQTYTMNQNGQSITIRKISSTAWKVE